MENPVKRKENEYEEENGVLLYCNEKEKKNEKEKDNEKDNENENDNEVSYHDTFNVSCNVSFKNTFSKSKDDEILKEEFDKLWKLYPKKVGRDKAFTKYKKYRTSQKEDYTTYEEVLSGLERYLKYIEQNRWYSPKDGSTWFQANKETIAYYMDPRNFLNENSIFMFQNMLKTIKHMVCVQVY